MRRTDVAHHIGVSAAAAIATAAATVATADKTPYHQEMKMALTPSILEG